MSGNVGVITEQGYPAGQFGFNKLNESDQAKIKNNDKTANDETKKQSK